MRPARPRARSTVRAELGTGFPGGTYRQVFYVADIEGTGAPMNGELHIDLDEADFLGVFPLAGAGRARLHRERARGRAGRIRPVDDAHADTLARQP